MCLMGGRTQLEHNRFSLMATCCQSGSYGIPKKRQIPWKMDPRCNANVKCSSMYTHGTYCNETVSESYLLDSLTRFFGGPDKLGHTGLKHDIGSHGCISGNCIAHMSIIAQGWSGN